MVLWTIQSFDAWQTLLTAGILHCDAQFSKKEHIPAYRWMGVQMDQRLSANRPADHIFPLWAWYQWNGEQKRKPDLRCSGHLTPGQKGIRITCQISDEQVLLSDFLLWHYVLNGWYLPISKADSDALTARMNAERLSGHKDKLILEPGLKRVIRKSWERIFDLEWTGQDMAFPRKKKSIQAAFWELRLEQVTRVDQFLAR